MRKILTGILITAICLSSCRKNDQGEVFDFTQRVDFTIDPGLNTIDTYFFPFDPLNSPLKQRLQDFNLTLDDITSISPKAAELTSQFGDENLDFIRKIIIRVHEPQNPVEGTEIFYYDPTPLRNTERWRPLPNISDVKDIMSNDFYGLEVRLDFRFVLTESINMKFEYKLRANR